MNFRLWYENEIYIPGPNLNIPRAEMPQIIKKMVPEFLKYLAQNNITVHKETIPTGKIKPIQAEINVPKVISMMQHTDLENDAPPIVSNDNYILDGHHRWLALLNKSRLNQSRQTAHDDYPILVWKVNTDMKTLLTLAKAWPFTKYKNIDVMA